jgi:hypothetical protein
MDRFMERHSPLCRSSLPGWRVLTSRISSLLRSSSMSETNSRARVGLLSMRKKTAIAGFRREAGTPRRTVFQCDQTTVWATLRIVCSEEVGPSLQGRVRFLLGVRLQHGNNPDCPSGTFSARRRRMGIFALAQLNKRN